MSKQLGTADTGVLPTWPHRVVCGNEADQVSRFHGMCIVCSVPWPCPSQRELDTAVLTAVGADLAAWNDAMRTMGWSG